MPEAVKKKIDLLLLDPPWYRFFGQQSAIKPLGLCSLAAVLEKNGFRVRVYKGDIQPGAAFRDAFSTTNNYQNYLRRINDSEDSVWQEIKKVLQHYSPRAVGIGIVTAKYRSALNLARIIKQLKPATRVIAGGVHPTLCPQEVLESGPFDAVVRGEGEVTGVELLDAICAHRPFTGIKGVSYKKNSGQIIHNPPRELIKDLDSLPPPANHLIVNSQGMLPDDFGYLLASRGCPYHCIFCAAHKVWGRQVRFRSPVNVVAEIEAIKQKYHPTYFHFQDDSFTLDKDFVREFAGLIKKKRIKIRWACETRADLISDEIARTIKRAGCFKVVLGAESGDETILCKIKKHVTADQIRKAVRICKRNHLETSLFFMIGFPWETEKEINNTIAFMQELNPQYAVFSVATPYPGTELYRVCREEGLLPSAPDWSRFFHQSPEMFLTRKLSAGQTRKIISAAENKFVRHNKKKHRLKLLNPYRLFLEIKRFYRQPKEIWSKIKYILK